MTPKKIRSDLSRRDFLKATSHLAAAASLAGCVTAPAQNSSTGAQSQQAATPAVNTSNNDTLKIALIGCGGRGSGAADQALSTPGPVKLVAMGDVHKDRLDDSYANLKQRHADRVDVPEENKFIGFDAYQHAIALADVVILATPPGFRPTHLAEAVKQSKNIFTEKPLAVDGPGVRKVLAAAAEAKQKNLKVGVGLQRHHQAGYIATIQRLHEGAIGDITAMRAYWNDAGVWTKARKDLEQQAGRPLTEMEYQMRNWYYFVWLCGDHIVEQHIHNLDVINWVKQGHPVKALGMGGRQIRGGHDRGEIFDHHAVEYIYADGSRLSSQCRHIPGCWSSVSEHVQGTKGTCDVGGYTIKGEAAWRFTTPGERNPYQQEHDDLFAAIRNGTPYNELEYGAFSTMTAVMGRMATYSGKEVTWDDALNSQIDTMPKVLGWDAAPPNMPDSDGQYPLAIPGVTVAF